MLVRLFGSRLTRVSDLFFKFRSTYTSDKANMRPHSNSATTYDYEDVPHLSLSQHSQKSSQQ